MTSEVHKTHCLGEPFGGSQRGGRPPPPLGVGSWLATTPALPNPCRLRSAQSRDNAKFIQGPFHIGDGQHVHDLWGQEAQKGKNSNKNMGKKAYRGIRCIKKRMCECTTRLPLFQDNYPNCAPQGVMQGAPQVPQDKHPQCGRRIKTYARRNNDAPSISNYGSLVQPNTQIVALR